MFELLEKITLIILGVLTLSICVLFFGFIYEIIFTLINQYKSNIKWDKTHKTKLRKRCLECSYCVKRTYTPFYYTKDLSHPIPKYCKKFKVQLNGNISLRCIAKLNSNALYED